jgi:hypothetical protein
MKRVAIPGAAMLLAIAVPADAELYHFEMTGYYAASFDLDSQPTVDAFSAGQYFRINNVAGSFEFTSNPVYLVFNSNAWGGGFEVYDMLTDFQWFRGALADLYAPPEAAPTFLLGAFHLDSDCGCYGSDLIVSPPISVVPEPASWALTIGGFGLAGMALRSRKAAISFG